MTAPQNPRPDDVYVTAKALRARFGNISDMSLWRWLRDEQLDFPKPVVINRRRYWRLNEIMAFEARQTRGEVRHDS